MEKPALLIIDMVKDYFKEELNYPITPLAKEIIAPINGMIQEFRKKDFPVIFATDAFSEKDFIFKSRMHPHAIKGTKGAEVISDLNMQKQDLWLPKPKFSAFFNTNITQYLKKRDITLCAVAGIATNVCVLTTVMDALCNDFKAVLLEDCSAAFSRKIHEMTLDIYRKNPLYPLFRVMKSQELAREL